MAHFRGDAHGWFLSLGAQMIDSMDVEPPSERAMTEHEASIFVPRGKPRPWLMMPGKAPCEATYGKRYAELVADGPWNWSFRIELEGCAAPQAKATAAIVVFADRPPSDCTVVPARDVAAFRDYTPGATPPPVPAELERFVGRASVKQVLLWRIRAIDLRGTDAFWSIDTSTLVIGKPGDECGWETTNLGMFYERSGASIAPFAYTNRSGTMEVYQHLHAALVDHETIRSIVVTNLGEYQVFDLTKTPRTVAHHLRWYIPHEEDYAGDGVLGPYCGP